MTIRPLSLGTMLATGVALTAVATLGIAAPTNASTADHHSTTSTRATSPKPTVVLVHGAWADSSSFGPVTKQLQHDGYTVMSAPNPLRGLSQDADSVAAFVNQATTGPVVLVGHSYGGSVITNAANDIPRVQALVYVDAYAPDEDESVVQLTGAKPGSALAVPDPSTVFNFVQYPGAEEGDVDTYIKPALFKRAFAAKLSAAQAKVLGASQEPVTLSALTAGSEAPAWASIKSFFFVGTKDKILPPAEQVAMAKRAHGVIVKRDADHLAMLETPKPIVDLIERAARTS
ncbi:alpha/beta fold hydrolase [Nocardioides mangrovi]|uniref:Alpha/beta hydrolase n=1 Tax=Nocardioides mangrovi TaxID=2874580 RepID=A0ABS7UBL9_9ACTN|nr:alpha/beta hydrolase [Nocardioides mangrovi]MBZ5738270.1 alpha/beta hydrolase [Nocardioides mangrovi]